MTVKEFFSKENIAKDDPFDNIELKQEVTMDEYKVITDSIMAFIFNEKNEYMPLIKDFAFKFWTIVIYADLDAVEMPETSEVFAVINCTNIFERFIDKLNYPSQIMNLRNTIDDCVNYYTSSQIMVRDIITRLEDVVTTLSSGDSIEKIIEKIKTEVFLNDTSQGDDFHVKD